MTDLFHQQEVTIDEDKLIFFFPRSVWDHFGIEKKLYKSFADEKSKPCFFNFIMSFINGIITQVRVFFCL